MGRYYNGQKLLNTKDLDNKEPAIYIITSNRSDGKTTYFLKYGLEQFKKHGKKTMHMFRRSYELNATNELYAGVLELYPDLGVEMKCIAHAKGLYYELFLDDESYGYSVSLANVDALKKYSAVFKDVDYIIFDEYQSEKGEYLTNEIARFQSVYVSVARGGGEQSRPVKVFLLGNRVTIMNPYYIQFGIHKRLKGDTRIMRGNGWVAEFNFNKSASDAIKANSFFSAFSDEDYMQYSTEDVYLQDSKAFIDKPKGRCKYIFTFVHNETYYGVREYFDSGILYISHKPDMTCKTIVAFKASDHNQNTMMISRYDYLVKNIKTAFSKGYLRFDDIKTKNATFDILAIDLFK